MSRPTRDSAAGRAYLDLQNRARREKRGTQELLTMYVVERWLSRLSHSPYADDFVLKGGMLLASFGTRRPTVDADALARNMESDESTVAQRVAEIAALKDPDDGVEFLTSTITTATIRDDALYAGVRVTMGAQLSTAHVKLRLDINFGDPITPEPQGSMDSTAWRRGCRLRVDGKSNEGRRSVARSRPPVAERASSRRCAPRSATGGGSGAERAKRDEAPAPPFALGLFRDQEMRWG